LKAIVEAIRNRLRRLAVQPAKALAVHCLRLALGQPVVDSQ
jgi:hypothetical protein